MPPAWPCLLLLVPILRGQDATADLQAADWRQRNAAARTLAASSTLDVSALLRTMQVEAHEFDRGHVELGGAGPGNDPVAIVVAECRREVAMVGGPLVPLGDHRPLTGVPDLVLPRTAPELAAWLLLRRPDLHDEVRRSWRTMRLEPSNRALARLWATLWPPTDDDVLAATARPELMDAVLHACAEVQPAALRTVALRGQGAAQDAALCITAYSAVDRPAGKTDQELLRAVALRFLGTDDSTDAARLGELLRHHGVAGLTVALAQRPGTVAARRRVTALAVVIAERHEIPIAAMQPFLADPDRTTVERSLCALRNPERDAKAAPALAAELFAMLANSRDARRAGLALHAVAGIGPDVPAPLAEQALACWHDQPWPRTRPALLAALMRLGVAGELPLAAKLAAAEEAGPWTPATRLVCAELAAQLDGGAAALLTLRRPSSRPILGKVAEDIAAGHPERLRPWLDEPRLRQPALEALAERAPTHLPPFAELWAATVAPRRPDVRMLEVLVRHPAAAEHGEELVAAVLSTDPGEQGVLGEYLRAHHRQLAVARRIELLAPWLERGAAWWLVQDAPADLLLSRLRGWFDACEDSEARARLGAELVRLGDHTAADHDRIAAQLANGRVFPLDKALSRLPHLPPTLRMAIEERITADLAANRPFDLDSLYDVLWAHRRP